MKLENVSRRRFLNTSVSTSLAWSLRSLATGVPVSFLCAGHMPALASEGVPKRLIMGLSSRGEAVNCHAPGTYPTRADDPRATIERPNAGELGTQVLGRIAGQDITAAHFDQPSRIQLGDVSTQASGVYAALPQALLDQLNVFHLQTHANGHPESPEVHRLNGALKTAEGRGVEEIQSAIAQELAPLVGSTLSRPIVFSSAPLTEQGTPLNQYQPLSIKNLFLGRNTLGVELHELNRVYDTVIDDVYKRLKVEGTPAQKRFLDAAALTRSQAAVLGDQLGELLEGISGNTIADEVIAAVALLKTNLTPVVTINHRFSGDNHGDTRLGDEAALTIEAVDNLALLWQEIQRHHLEDSVNYASFGVFSRTTRRNALGGRDHNSRLCTNFLVGSNIKAGVTGTLLDDGFTRKPDLKASGINSVTGLSLNPDIDESDTLVAYGRTLMASVGIPQSRINVRIPSGTTVNAALLSA